jgi:GAF domain-containing protein
VKGRAEVLSQVRRQVTDICHRALDTPTFKARVVTALRRAVPVDAVFLASADPDTLLLTGGISDAVIRSAAPLFLRNEFLEDDVNKFFQLAQARPPVWSLFAATGGRMAASARYREILEPLHLGDELRVALVSGRLCWGYLCLHREAGSVPFTSEDAAFLASLGPFARRGPEDELDGASAGCSRAGGRTRPDRPGT